MQKALLVAMVLGFGVIGCGGPEDVSSEEGMATEVEPANLACQAPGTFVRTCYVWGNGPFQSGCGTTWSYWVCKQYKNSQDQWWRQECGPQQYYCNTYPFGSTGCIDRC